MAADPTRAQQRGPRFLVTGACGAVGAWAVKRLIDQGTDVVAEGSSDDRVLRLVLTSAQVAALNRVEGATADLAKLQVAMKGVTHVVHTETVTAADRRRDPATAASSTIGRLDNVLHAAATAKVPVAYQSSMAVFGPSDRRAGSDDARTPLTLLGCYALANELNAARWSRRSDVSSVGLRTNLVFGPGQDIGLTGTPTRAIAEALGGRRFRLELAGTADFQYVGDVADALIAAASRPAEMASVINLRGHIATFAEFAKAVGAATGSHSINDDPTDYALRIAADEALELDWLPSPLPTSIGGGIRSTLEALRWAPRDLY